MALLWQAVAEKLLAALPTLPGWAGVTIFDGAPVTGDNPAVYCTVGYVSGDEAGTFGFQQAPSGYEQIEQGDVRSELVCQTGDVDMAAMRAQAFSLIEAVYGWARADRTLGGTLPPQSEVTVATTVQSMQNSNGTAQAITFAVQYYAIS